MVNQVDAKLRERQTQIDKEVLAAIDFELEGAIAHAGGILTGFSVKIAPGDVLMTLRAKLPGGQMVAFVGCPDLPSCLRKAVTEAYSDALRWREDVYHKKEV